MIISVQVIINLQTTFKELVENSIDAGATNIGKRSFIRVGTGTVQALPMWFKVR